MAARVEKQLTRNFQSLQVLRGVACLLVVFFHASELYQQKLGGLFFGNIFFFGSAGVDVFFTLSGFIIAFTSFSSLGKPANIIPFAIKRFIRIYPIYWIVITALLVMQLLAPAFYRSGYSPDITSLFSTYLLLPAHQMVNGVSWTLTNELFFYLVFSLAFLLPFPKLLIAIITGYMLLLPFVPAAYQQDGNSTLLSLVFFPMNIEFFLGVLVATFFHHLPARYARLVITTGIAWFIGGAVLYDLGIQVAEGTFNRVILFGFPSALVITGLVKLESLEPVHAGAVFRNPGDASYTLYLVHLPLLAAGAILLAFTGAGPVMLHLMMLVLVLVITLLSIVIYRMVEKPMITNLNRLLIKPKVILNGK